MYPVKMEKNKIIPLKPIDDEKVKKEIEEIQIFCAIREFQRIGKL